VQAKLLKENIGKYYQPFKDRIKIIKNVRIKIIRIGSRNVSREKNGV